MIRKKAHGQTVLAAVGLFPSTHQNFKTYLIALRGVHFSPLIILLP